MSTTRITAIVIAAILLLAIPIIGVRLVVVGAPIWERYHGDVSSPHVDSSSPKLPADR